MTGKTSVSRRDALRSLLAEEEKEFLPFEDLLQRLAELEGEDVLLRLLRAKDRQHRHSYYVKSERLWFRRFGFRVMRPLFLVGVVAAVAFSFQRVIDPTLAFACFAGGAATLYLAIQFFSMRWMRQDEARLAEIERAYRSELADLRDELAGR